MLVRSFRLPARAVLPLALLFILSACGGGTTTEPVSTRVVRGPGFSFAVPGSWQTSRSQRTVSSSDGKAQVSVTTYTLLKPYRPAIFAAAARELDRVAAQLAAEAGAKVTKSETLDVAGRKSRAYRFGTMRIGFVLVGKREFQLLCREPGGACTLLFESFSLT
jgi:hypothetical protein